MFEGLYKTKTQLGIIVFLCFILNFNTLNNKYALDDEIIINLNLNVQSGNDGIGKIIKTDAFQGYLDMAGVQSPISGGRFRPLSIITFAMEQSFFGETLGLQYRQEQNKLNYMESSGASAADIQIQIKVLQNIKDRINESAISLAPIRHFIQVLLFILSMIVLFFFLRKHIFSSNSILSFISVVLFVIHPVHTEVIANIKSRDEILSLLFIILTLHFCFNYVNEKSRRNLWLAIISYVFALLSKEYAMILPVLVVIGWITIHKLTIKEILNPLFLRLCLIAAFFIIIRFTFFSNVNVINATVDTLNDPYLLASPLQTFASKTAILLEYFRVLFFPMNLSSDYSYAHFSYIDIASWKFVVSFLLYISLISLFLYSFIKKKAITFPLGLFLGFLFLINNLIFPIGATMGERLVYHSSLGLCIILVMLGDQFMNKRSWDLSVKRVLVFSLLLPIILLFSYKTIARNSEWQSNYTLFTHDVKTVPNSALANCNAATEIYNSAYTIYNGLKKPSLQDRKNYELQLKNAIQYFDKALAIHNKYVVAFTNRGLCYYHLGDKDRAAEDWIKAAEYFNGTNSFLKQNSYVFFQEGIAFGSKKEFEKAIKPLFIASKMNPNDASIWTNLGGAYFMTGKFKLSVDAFSKALSINGSLQEAQNGKRVAQSIYSLEESFLKNSSDDNIKMELEKAYVGCGVSREFLRIKF